MAQQSCNASPRLRLAGVDRQALRGTRSGQRPSRSHDYWNGILYMLGDAPRERHVPALVLTPARQAAAGSTLSRRAPPARGRPPPKMRGRCPRMRGRRGQAGCNVARMHYPAPQNRRVDLPPKIVFGPGGNLGGMKTARVLILGIGLAFLAGSLREGENSGGDRRSRGYHRLPAR